MVSTDTSKSNSTFCTFRNVSRGKNWWSPLSSILLMSRKSCDIKVGYFEYSHVSNCLGCHVAFFIYSAAHGWKEKRAQPPTGFVPTTYWFKGIMAFDDTTQSRAKQFVSNWFHLLCLINLILICVTNILFQKWFDVLLIGLENSKTFSF